MRVGELEGFWDAKGVQEEEQEEEKTLTRSQDRRQEQGC